MDLPAEKKEELRNKITEKSCICNNLGNGLLNSLKMNTDEAPTASAAPVAAAAGVSAIAMSDVLDMLKRQQAQAIVAARRQIVDGAVGMVKMALDELRDQDIIELDDERKAAMISNLLVVLCGEENAQPVLNTGSLYS